MLLFAEHDSVLDSPTQAGEYGRASHEAKKPFLLLPPLERNAAQYFLQSQIGPVPAGQQCLSHLWGEARALQDLSHVSLSQSIFMSEMANAAELASDDPFVPIAGA